jgi:hypothetical protein
LTKQEEKPKNRERKYNNNNNHFLFVYYTLLCNVCSSCGLGKIPGDFGVGGGGGPRPAAYYSYKHS